MKRSFERSVEKLDVKLAESSREVYIEYIDRVLDMAAYKFEHRQTKNRERIVWGRLIVQAVSAGNQVLKDKDLEELVERVRAVEEKLS